MAFNIKKHILDHAAAVWNDTEDLAMTKNKSGEVVPLHFKFSLDDAQLISKGLDTPKKREEYLKAFFKDLVQTKFEFLESKGGGKYRTKTLDLSKTLAAFHYSSFEDKTNNIDIDDINNKAKVLEFNTKHTTKPHFHLLFDSTQKNNLGFQYSSVKLAVSELAKQHGLTFHFMEDIKDIDTNTSSKKSSNFSWAIQKMNNEEFYNFAHSQNFWETIEIFKNDTKLNGQIDFFAKTMRNIQKRGYQVGLKLKLPDLQDVLSVEDNKKMLALYNVLREREIDYKKLNKLLADRSNKFSRAYLEHLYGCDNAVIKALSVYRPEF